MAAPAGGRWQPSITCPARETSEAGRPIPISGPSDRRLDPSAAAAGHRVPEAENRVLRERLGTGRLRFKDAERRLLAEKGEGLGRTMLGPRESPRPGNRGFLIGETRGRQLASG